MGCGSTAGMRMAYAGWKYALCRLHAWHARSLFQACFPLKHIKKWLYWVPAEYWILRAAYRVLLRRRRRNGLPNKASGYTLERLCGAVRRQRAVGRS